MTFTDNGNGTATLAGTPAAGTSGSYPITITAANGVSPNATQSFTLTVNPALAAPVITSASADDLRRRAGGDVHGDDHRHPDGGPVGDQHPGPAVRRHLQGQRQRDGHPGRHAASGQPGHYTLTVTANNSAGTATQSFALTVNSGLAITSAGSATATAGKAFSFTVPPPARRADPDPGRNAALGHHIHRQHQRHGDPVRHADGGREGTYR